jgi:hypothetical protein
MCFSPSTAITEWKQSLKDLRLDWIDLKSVASVKERRDLVTNLVENVYNRIDVGAQATDNKSQQQVIMNLLQKVRDTSSNQKFRQYAEEKIKILEDAFGKEKLEEGLGIEESALKARKYKENLERPRCSAGATSLSVLLGAKSAVKSKAIISQETDTLIKHDLVYFHSKN